MRMIDADAAIAYLENHKKVAKENGFIWVADEDAIIKFLKEKCPTLTPPTEWVSVEDRLPDTDGAYLVYAPTYTGGSSSSLDCIGGIMFSRFKHKKWSIESGYYKRPNCVTHWMPIPAPPKG